MSETESAEVEPKSNIKNYATKNVPNISDISDILDIPDKNIDVQEDDKEEMNRKVWFDCRGEKIWTYLFNIQDLGKFKDVGRNRKEKDIIIPVDDEKKDVHNFINYVSNKRYIDCEKLGDMIYGFEHIPTLKFINSIAENIKPVSKYGSVHEINQKNARTYKLNVSKQKIFVVNLVVRAILNNPNSGYEDNTINDVRYITLYD